jgi:hypothetical protein
VGKWCETHRITSFAHQLSPSLSAERAAGEDEDEWREQGMGEPECGEDTECGDSEVEGGFFFLPLPLPLPLPLFLAIFVDQLPACDGRRGKGDAREGKSRPSWPPVLRAAKSRCHQARGCSHRFLA